MPIYLEFSPSVPSVLLNRHGGIGFLFRARAASMGWPERFSVVVFVCASVSVGQVLCNKWKQNNVHAPAPRMFTFDEMHARLVLVQLRLELRLDRMHAHTDGRTTRTHAHTHGHNSNHNKQCCFPNKRPKCAERTTNARLCAASFDQLGEQGTNEQKK